MINITTELLTLILLFVLTFFVAFQSLKRIFQQNISVIISLIIALIVTVYISYSELQWLKTLYAGTGVTILILAPSIVAFFFVYSTNINGLLRKMFWTFYAIMIILLLQTNVNLSSETTTSIILGTVLATVLLIMFDTKIKNFFNTRKNLAKRKY